MHGEGPFVQVVMLCNFESGGEGPIKPALTALVEFIVLGCPSTPPCPVTCAVCKDAFLIQLSKYPWQAPLSSLGSTTNRQNNPQAQMYLLHPFHSKTYK